MSKLLTNKTSVITGCLSGIGRETVQVFAENGSDIFACIEKNDNDFFRYAKDISKVNNVSIIPIVFDMMKTEEIKNAFTEIKSHKKEIHALVNIAGIARDALFRMVTDEDMQKTFQINLFAQIKLTQFISNLMIREKTKGSIVFTSSFAAVFGEMGQLTYAASKAALLGVLRPLSDELGEKGIRVNAVKPGVIDTPIQNSVPDKILEKRVESISLRRMGTAEEVANLFLFLASDLSSHITGQAIKIDGDMGGV